MNDSSRLMDMLTGYAAAHQHPVNIAVHMIGIPAIMLGALVALSWVEITLGGVTFNLAWVLVAVFFAFYLSLDALFAIVFLLVAALMTIAATSISGLEFALSASIAAALFFGGYIAQFIGHAIEKSQPVLLKHPIQAQFAAPFFTIVEAFQLLGLRDELFREVHARIAQGRDEQTQGS